MNGLIEKYQSVFDVSWLLKTFIVTAKNNASTEAIESNVAAQINLVRLRTIVELFTNRSIALKDRSTPISFEIASSHTTCSALLHCTLTARCCFF